MTCTIFSAAWIAARINVITIDPDDAKDFDDAICLERVSAEQWRLWVHIADVSHYVKPGTALDAEAQKRGNSTYLVDRVIPMLPEALSNELCSLKPNVDRLTKCVEFLISNDGRVLNTKFYSAVIHSKRRFTYAQVLEILQRAPAGGARSIAPRESETEHIMQSDALRSSQVVHRSTAIRLSRCCTRRMNWRKKSAAHVSRTVRWNWIFPK